MLSAAAAANGIRRLADMDDETRADIRELVGNGVRDDFEVPCDVGHGAGTLKCEACPGGCQLYSTDSPSAGLANERSHYSLPRTMNDRLDVILFRAHSKTMWASVRSIIDF